MPAHKTKSQECKNALVKVAVLLLSKENRKPIHIKSNHKKLLKSVLHSYHYSAPKARLGSLFRLLHARICLRQSSQHTPPNLCRLECQICLNRTALPLSSFPHVTNFSCGRGSQTIFFHTTWTTKPLFFLFLSPITKILTQTWITLKSGCQQISRLCLQLISRLLISPVKRIRCLQHIKETSMRTVCVAF